MILKSCLILTIFLLNSPFRGTQAHRSSDDDILGVNILGLKAGLNTNLFGKEGPLAKAVDNLQNLKKNSDSFLNRVGQNTANFFDKLGSSLLGSSHDDASSSGSHSQSGSSQGSSSGSGQISSGGSSQTRGGSNFELSLKGKSKGSWNGFENAGSSSSGSSSTSGGRSGSISLTGDSEVSVPTITINGGSRGSVSHESSGGSSTWSLGGSSDSDSEGLSLDGKRSVWNLDVSGRSLPRRGSTQESSRWSSNGGSSALSTNSGSDESSDGSSTGSLGGSSDSDSEGLSLDGARSVWNLDGSGRSLPRRGSTQESSRWSLSGGSSGLSTNSGSDESSDGSSTWSLEGSSGSVPGGASALESSKWSLNGGGTGTVSGGSTVSGRSPIWTWSRRNSGSASGGTAQNGGSTSEGSSKWSLSGGGSVHSNGQVSNTGNNLWRLSGGGGSSKTSNSGGSSSGSSSGNLVGVNVLGLKAGFCTNIFNENGPLAKAGENLKNILEGKKLTNLEDLNNILGVNIGDAKADLTTNFLGNGRASNAKSEQEILGKTILGLHEGLNTNLLSKEGPLAKVGDDLKDLLEGKLSLGDLISGKGSAASSNDNIVGVNALGVKLALCTNLFDKDGPLAKAGADISGFFDKLGETNSKIWTNLRNVFGNAEA